MNFDPIIDRIIAVEKGYVDNPNDRGGPTMFGITQSVARANGWMGRMQDLPIALVRQIYLDRYIIKPAFNAVAELSADVGGELIDTGVNMGPSRPSEFFQRMLNSFNIGGSRYSDIFVDGRIGPVTLDAFKTYLEWRGKEGERVMVVALNCLQGARYLDIVENDLSQRTFMYGWLLNRVVDQLNLGESK